MGYKGKLSGAQIDSLPNAISDLEEDVVRLNNALRPLIIETIIVGAFNAGQAIEYRLVTEDWTKMQNGGRVVFVFSDGMRCDVVSRSISSSTSVVAWINQPNTKGIIEVTKVILEYDAVSSLMRIRKG